MKPTELNPLELLQAVQYALNAIPNRSLRGCPHGIESTYQLASIIDNAVSWLEANMSQEDSPMIKPHDFFKYIRADEVAECWDGVSDELYRALWAIVPYQKEIPNIEDSGPHDHVGHENLAAHWHRLDDPQREQLNELAHEQDARFDSEDKGPRDYESGNPAEREPNE